MKTAQIFTAKIDLAASRTDTDGVRVLLIQARAQSVLVDGDLLRFEDCSSLRVIDGGALVIPYESAPDFRPEPTRSVQILSIARR